MDMTEKQHKKTKSPAFLAGAFAEHPFHLIKIPADQNKRNYEISA